MVIQALTKKDSEQIAKLHAVAFKGFFLTSLGKKFLKSFYSSLIKHPSGIAIGIFENDNLIAFAVGTKVKSKFYLNLMKKNFIIMVWSALPRLIIHPSIVFKLLSSLKTKDTQSRDVLNGSSLLSICVSPNRSGEGLGIKMLSAFEKVAFNGSQVLSLTTDAINNDYVNNFYQKNNYKLSGTFLQNDRKMNLYIKLANENSFLAPIC